MRMLLTAEEVSEALQTYVNDQVTLKDNQEVSVEIAADGSASVDFRNTGKPAARKPTPRKGKAKAADPKANEKAEPEAEKTPEPETPEEAEASGDAENEPQSDTEVEPTSSESHTSPAPTKSVFSMGDKMKKTPKEDNLQESKTEEAPVTESRLTGTSIFSRVS